MPIGNIVRTRAKDEIKKRMGQYSPYVLNLIGGPIDQAADRLNATETAVLQKIPGSVNQLGTVVFESSRGLPPVSRLGRTPILERLGVITDGSEAIPDQYLITISSAKIGIITAIMQEKTSFRITSDWEPFLPLGGVTQAANVVTQAVGGRALLSRFMTRRIWKGTSPVEINTNLIFETVSNAYRNVVAPTMRLMQMVLPSKTGGVGYKGFNIPLVAPPGPSPFKLEQVKDIKKIPEDERTLWQNLAVSLGEGGDQISVKVGRYLNFKSVIVKDVQPMYDTRLDADGWPIRAEVNITFQTYEIITKEVLKDEVFAKQTRVG